MESTGGFGGALLATPHDACNSHEPEQGLQAAESWPTVDRFLSMPNDELGKVDRVVMNLVVAQGIPSLAYLDIGHYVRLADEWAAHIQRSIPARDANFHRNPGCWKNDLDFSRLAVVWSYIEQVLSVAYREDQREVCLADQKRPPGMREGIRYTDPSDLFLNGVMDTRRGTCANMALLFVSLCWRLGWPVRLACVGSHFIARYDDGTKVFNIEATLTGDGPGRGFSSPPDEHYLKEYGLPQRAVDCGSDLRAITPREMLGVFVGLRARHLENINCFPEAEPDYLLARYLFPKNRQLYISQNQTSVQCSMDLFEPHEKGHPVELARWLQEVVRVAPWGHKDNQSVQEPKEMFNGSIVDAIVAEVVGGRFLL
jgi:hypothetical protein